MRLSAAALLLVVGALSSTATVAQEADPASKITVEEGDMLAGDLINRWASATGRISVLDPTIEGIQIHFNEAGAVDPLTLRRLLDFHDVVVTETGPLINAHHRRNLAQKEGPPWRLVKTFEELEGLNEVVTWVAKIKNGAGNSIFATVRGLLTRDTNRIGNILYVQGPELVIIVDLADKVRYYREVIESLDVAPPSGRVDVQLLELPRTQWRELNTTKTGDSLVAALTEAEKAGRANLIEDASLPVLGGRFSLVRSLELGKGEEVFLEVSCAPPAQTPHQGKVAKLVGRSTGRGLELSVDLSMQQAGQRLKRSLRVPVSQSTAQAGTQIIAFAGRDGTQFVLLVQSR